MTTDAPNAADVTSTFPLLKRFPASDRYKPQTHAMLKRAYAQAARSNDPNTHVGAIMACDKSPHFKGGTVGAHNRIIGLGTDSTRADRPKKYDYSVHAEAGAVANATQFGYRTKHANLYAPWFACTHCAKMIGEAGISVVIGHASAFALTPERWVAEIQRAHEILTEEYNVKLYAFEGLIGAIVKMDGVTHEV